MFGGVKRVHPIKELNHYSERLWVLEEFHPFAKDSNEKIIHESMNFEWMYHDHPSMGNIDGSRTNIKSWQTANILVNAGKNVAILHDWVLRVLTTRRLAGGFNMYIWPMWMAKYTEEEYTIPHYHVPASYAFVYFVKASKGAAPLVFTTSGKKVKAEEGKLVVFPGFMQHHVPNNKCKERITIAGNIMPKEFDKTYSKYLLGKIS